MNDDTNKQPALVSRLGRRLLNVVSMVLIFSFGLVVGMTSNTNFPKLYFPFVPLRPSPMPSPPPVPAPALPPPPPSPQAKLSPPPPTTPPMLPPQNTQMGLTSFLATSGVMHNMTDEELFWRASMVPQITRWGDITLAQWRKGVDWFEMDRDLAVTVVADDAYFPAFREYCARRRNCLMDEHYVATLLSVLGWSRNANQTVTYEDWRRGGSHPRTHRGRDVTEELIRHIRGGAGKNCTYNGRPGAICYLFARKFAPDALDPLLAMAPKLMGFG